LVPLPPLLRSVGFGGQLSLFALGVLAGEAFLLGADPSAVAYVDAQHAGLSQCCAPGGFPAAHQGQVNQPPANQVVIGRASPVAIVMTGPPIMTPCWYGSGSGTAGVECHRPWAGCRRGTSHTSGVGRLG